MKISELKAGTTSVDIEDARLVDKQEPRDVVSKYGKQLRVCNAAIKDSTGSINISLWNDTIEAVNVGDRVRITNAQVIEYRGNPQISLGKNGRIEVI